MSIELTCEKCGNPFRVPRDQAGRVHKCPHCGNDLYIPTPEEEIEELPLAPEDQSEQQRMEQLLAERRRIDRILAGAGENESSPATGATPPPRPADRAAGVGRTTVRGVLMAYLTALRDSDLRRAEEAIALLKTRPEDALRVLDQIAADQIPPAEMAKVPPAVYQGFLKTLRSKLR